MNNYYLLDTYQVPRTFYLHYLTTTLHSRWHSSLFICNEAKVTKGEMTYL